MVTGESSNVSSKSRGAALALCVCLGFTGAHRFYSGKYLTGFLQLVTIGGMGLWWLYDLILISAGGWRDADDRRITRWAEADEPSGHLELKGERLQMLLDEIDTQRDEIGDLSERVDFLERMLTQARDRGLLPRAQ